MTSPDHSPASSALSCEAGLAGCLAAARVLGEPWQDDALGLNGMIVDDWESPSFSPLIYEKPQPPSERLLALIEERFRANPVTNSFIDPRPYLLVPLESYRQSPEAFEAAFAGQGWSTQADPLSFNRVLPPRPLVIPEAATVSLADTGRRPLPEEYRELLAASFSLAPAQLDSLTSLFLASPAETMTICVHDEAGTVVAGGTVSALNGTATLTWGTVAETHRGRDIHRTLIGACVATATSQGAKECWLATRNPRVRYKWDGNFDTVIARRREPLA